MVDIALVRRTLATAGMRGAGQSPDLLDRRSKPPKGDLSDAIWETAKDVGLGVVRPVFTGLEYLGRPWASAVEAYGAHEAGRDPYRAAKRVLKGGMEKARYPTIGERFVPEEEDEGLGRWAKRFAVEVATDPTTWLGPGIIKGIGGGVVKGGAALAKSKAVQALAGSDLAQGLARAALPAMENLSYYGGKAGEKVGMGLRRAAVNKDKLFNREQAALLRKAHELKLGGKANEARRIAAANLIRTGAIKRPGFTSGDAAVDDFARYLSRRFEVAGRGVRRFRDPTGAGVEITHRMTKPQVQAVQAYAKANKKGFRQAYADLSEQGILQGRYLGKKMYATPFQMLDNYYPQVMKQELLEKSLSQRGMNDLAAELMTRLKISRRQAETLVRQQTGRVKKAGHIEHARTRRMPEDMLELDPLKVVPRYMNQTLHRLTMGAEFGLDGKKAERWLRKAVDEGVAGRRLSPKTAQQALNEIRGVVEDSPLDRIAPKILGWQVLTKMGPTSVVAQASQNALTIVAEGTGNFAKGITKLIASSDMRRRAAETFAGGLRAQMRHLAGSPDAGGLFGKWLSPGGYLRVTGFTPMDAGNRGLAYAAGTASAEAAARKALKRGLGFTDELKQMGVTEPGLRYFERVGAFPPSVERRIGLEASEKTQFLNRFTDLPPVWQTPSFRIATQFKSFTYGMTRFLMKDVMAPAIKYFDTGGKAGSIGPLMRAMIALPAAGNGVAALRELIQEQSAQMIGARRKRRRKFDYDHPVAQMLQDSMFVGAFGLAGDALQQAAHGKFLEFALGPTAADIANMVEYGAQKLSSGNPPTVEEFGRLAYPHVPFRRVLPLQPQEVVQAVDRAMR